MKNEHALRFLLLRHFNIVRPQIPAEDFDRVAQSLHIEVINGDYKVTWEDKGRQERLFPKASFQFYERGDINPEGRALTDSLVNRNDEQARQFSEEIFGRKLDFNRLAPKAWDPLDVFDMSADAVFLLIIILIGEMRITSVAALFPLFYLEYFRMGRVWAAVCLTVLSFTDWAGGVLIAAPVFTVLQYLDPSPYMRPIRLIFGGLAFIAAAFVIIGQHQGPFHFGMMFWLAVMAGIALSIFRILFSCDHRSVRLMLPFFCAGLISAGFSKTGEIGLCYGVLNLFVHAYGFTFIPFLNRTVKNA